MQGNISLLANRTQKVYYITEMVTNMQLQATFESLQLTSNAVI